ncbi:DEAD/DEAH box helicase [candidate division KSB1 bacterium]|nr:DEAD/DEAH box helicase [candidate division KSB1 bacterium]
MTTKPAKYITHPAIDSIREYINETGGQEVYLVGHTNHQRVVEDVEIFARGNETSVPAILHVAKYGDVVMHNHPSGLLEPSQADIAVATQLGNNGVGFYILNNDVTEIYVVVEALVSEEINYLDGELLSELLTPGGKISKHLGGFEFRPQQIKMVLTICEAFNENKIAIIEAGTGVGKTMAYLIPAIYWAVKNKERCAISTNTINLQEQLIKKDIPLLQEVLDVKFKAVLVKGRSNYACLRKVEEVYSDIGLLAEENEKEELLELIQWARRSKDGSKSDLNFLPLGYIWEKIAADSDTCIRTKCPHFKACFVNRARREAIHADIMVVNHHLLFADLTVRQSGGEVAVLPTYNRLILDEAHHVEDVATNYFGSGITRLGIARMLSHLYRHIKGQQKGLLPVLLSKLVGNTKFSSTYINQIRELVQYKLIPAIEELDVFNSETMESIYQIVKEKDENEFGESKLRLTEAIQLNQAWRTFVLEAAKNFITSLRLFTNQVAALTKLLDMIDASRDEKLLSLQVEIDARSARLSEAANTIDQVLFKKDTENVRWIEAVARNVHHLVRLHSSPLEVAELLKTNIYDIFKTVILTSATLTVKGIPNLSQFDYLENRLGLNFVNKIRRLELILPAPFNYKEQAVIIIPLDIPLPSHQSFSTKLKELIFQALKISKGSAFVLFTSYGLLNLIYQQLEDLLRNEGIPAIKQGSENRHQLLERFKSTPNSALFGTDSFWEGVDVQGKALESVIITKLPFKVPTEPIIEARVESISKRGGNAFMEYTIPQATIKFKQGFGRLIRSKSDRGSVIIFDKRVIEMQYGKIFIESLPECQILSGTTEQVFNALTEFFKYDKKL